MTRSYPVSSCILKAVLVWLVILVAGAGTPRMLLAQDTHDADVRANPDATSDLLEQMTELMEKSGTTGNPAAAPNLSAIMQSPDFQALLKGVLASGDLGGLGSRESASSAGPLLLGLLPSSLVGMIVLAYAANLLLARILFAVNVFINARRLGLAGTPPLLMGPTSWALAVVIGGMLVVLLYWLMHHSTLSKLQQKR